ncbi:MAG: hypothetical protein ACEY3M_02715, partial [Wolbachia sp.]
YPEINMWKVVETWINSQHESKIGYREKIKSSYPIKTIQGILISSALNCLDQWLETTFSDIIVASIRRARVRSCTRP